MEKEWMKINTFEESNQTAGQDGKERKRERSTLKTRSASEVTQNKLRMMSIYIHIDY
jgi:hypothetical protein